MKSASLASIVILSSTLLAAGGAPPAPLNFRVMRYVSPSGSGTNDGTSAGSPWSLSYALTQAGPTNILNLLPGVYPSFLISNPGTMILSRPKWGARVVGSSGLPGIWTSDNVGNVVIDGVEVAASSLDGIQLNGSNCAVRNCWIHDSAANGIYTRRNANNLVECNLIERNGDPTPGGSGLNLSGTNCVIRGNVIRYNRAWGCQVYDATASSSAECQFYNNLLYGNGNGVTVWSPSGQTNYVFNNTIVASTNFCLVSDYGNLCVSNNILIDANSGQLLAAADGAFIQSDYNLVSGASSVSGPHDVVITSPGFMNPTAGLYWLTALSPARGMANPGVIPPLDFFRKSEFSVSDVGAVQYSPALASDTRVLDPSPTHGADYWAVLTYSSVPPSFVLQPQSQTVLAGQSATFVASAAGSGPLLFQWTFNGVPVGSSSAYTLSNCQIPDNGGRIQVTVSNPMGSVVSSTVTLTVNPMGKSFFVSPNGSRANNGLSIGSPWPLDYALANAGASNTIVLEDGAYYTNINLSTPSIHSGLTIRALNKWGASFFGPPGRHVVHTGYGVSNCVIDGLHFVYSYQDDVNLCGGGTVQNCWISGAGRPPGWTTNTVQGQGVYVSTFASTNTPVTIIQYSLIESNGNTIGQDHGIYITASNTVVRGNVIRYNMAYGYQAASNLPGSIITGEQFYNNLVYGNGVGNGGKNCIVINANEFADTVVAATNWVFNNTLLNNGLIPVVLAYNGTIYLTNNIIVGGNGSWYLGNIDIVSGVGYSDYNVVTNSFSGSHAVDGGHNVITSLSSIGFVNATNGLYWLTGNSPARSAAYNRPPPVDFFGAPQGSVSDIGAFQYNALYETDTRALDPSSAYPDYWGPR